MVPRERVSEVNDDELTDAWERGEVFASGVTHEQHVRVAWTLLRRHQRTDAIERIVAGTRRACAAHGVPERFDEAITRSWIHVPSTLSDDEGTDVEIHELLRRHPHLADGRWFGSRS